jgi:hypothetical protein
MLFRLFFFFIFSVYSQDIDCPRAKEATACKGECGNFIDANKNGICDIWEKAHPKKAIIVTERNKIDDREKISTEKKEAANFIDKINKFNLVYFISFFLILISISEILKKNANYIKIHRDIYNWILSFSFFLCALSGIFLYFDFLIIDKNALFKLHLISGFISFMVGLYHFIERIKMMYPFRK